MLCYVSFDNMLVHCDQCQAKYKISIKKNPGKPVTFKCGKCQNLIRIAPEDILVDQSVETPKPVPLSSASSKSETVKVSCLKCGNDFIKPAAEKNPICYQCRIDSLVDNIKNKYGVSKPEPEDASDSKYTIRSADGLVLGPIKLRTVSVLAREKRVKGVEEVSRDDSPFKPLMSYPELAEMFPALKEIMDTDGLEDKVDEAFMAAFGQEDDGQAGPAPAGEDAPPEPAVPPPEEPDQRGEDLAEAGEQAGLDADVGEDLEGFEEEASIPDEETQEDEPQAEPVANEPEPSEPDEDEIIDFSSVRSEAGTPHEDEIIDFQPSASEDASEDEIGEEEQGQDETVEEGPAEAEAFEEDVEKIGDETESAAPEEDDEEQEDIIDFPASDFSDEKKDEGDLTSEDGSEESTDEDDEEFQAGLGELEGEAEEPGLEGPDLSGEDDEAEDIIDFPGSSADQERVEFEEDEEEVGQVMEEISPQPEEPAVEPEEVGTEFSLDDETEPASDEEEIIEDLEPIQEAPQDSRYRIRYPDGLILGPVKLETIGELFDSGNLTGQEEVQRDEDAWTGFSELPELAALVSEAEVIDEDVIELTDMLEESG